MNHYELLEELNEIIEDFDKKYDNSNPYYKSLRAVVEFHEPFEFTWGEETSTACYCGEMYPCPTIEAIKKELG